MTTTRDDIATRHGGTPAHCAHSANTYCSRCASPLHCVVDETSAYQFPNAAGAVMFVREYGKVAADATKAAWLASRG